MGSGQINQDLAAEDGILARAHDDLAIIAGATRAIALDVFFRTTQNRIRTGKIFGHDGNRTLGYKLPTRNPLSRPKRNDTERKKTTL
jgi:hypothetical protein